jgi:lipoprotein-releasing system permease protein
LEFSVYRLKLILRYLRARRITVIPIAAVTVAVFLLIVVLSVMNGFSSFIQKQIRGTLSDIIVEHEDARGFADFRRLSDEISRLPGVEAISPHLSGKAMLTLYSASGSGRAYDTPCIFIGVDLDAENRVSRLKEMLIPPDCRLDEKPDGDEDPGLVAGDQLLPYMIVPGYPAGLTTPTATDEDSALRFRYVGRFKSGLYEYDRTTAYIPLWAAQKLMCMDGRVTSLHVRTAPGADLDAVKESVLGVLAPRRGFVVKTWKEAQKVLIDAMKMERVIWVVILSALLAVAGFCILAVMSLTVIQKTRDIGILRSLGASVLGILSTFVQYGLAAGLVGATLGLAGGYAVLRWLDSIERWFLAGGLADGLVWLAGLGILIALVAGLMRRGTPRTVALVCVIVAWSGVAWGLSVTHGLDWMLASVRPYLAWSPWPRDIFYFDVIPREMSWTSMLTFWAGGIIVSFAASLIPAFRAARTNPVKTLRYE